MTSKTIPCAHCEKMLVDDLARWTHAKAKHSGKKKHRPKREDDDDDESFADRAIAASIAIACGEPTDDDWLLS